MQLQQALPAARNDVGTSKKVHRQWGVHLTLTLLSFLCLIPLVLIISASFTDENALAHNGFTLLPSQFSTFAYSYILHDPGQIVNAYGVTIFITVVGSTVSLTIMSLLAYVLSRKTFKWRRGLSFFIFFTMLFNGGLVPWYIFITQYLHMKNTIQVLIVPYLVIPWFVLLLRTYFSQIPDELLDAARIDGAGELRIFFQLVVPLSTPALATVGLFSALMFWNDWWLALLFVDDRRLAPLQYLLYNISMNIDYLSANPHTTGMVIPVLSVRMAMAVLALGPIAFAYLFLQKYFIRGITVGALK